jgi:cardiolipin synthase
VEPTRTGAPGSSGRILTIPNGISFARLAGVPVFLYLLFGLDAKGAAVAVLVVGGTTDWVDGFVARRMRQESRLGELLDPLVDRLYILATLLAFTALDVLPWAFTLALLAREAVMIVALGVLRYHGFGPPQVHYLGKTATFMLLAAFPVLLLSAASAGAAPVAGPVGWALAWWGIVLYWLAAGLYVWQVTTYVRGDRRPSGGAPA